MNGIGWMIRPAYWTYPDGKFPNRGRHVRLKAVAYWDGKFWKQRWRIQIIESTHVSPYEGQDLPYLPTQLTSLERGIERLTANWIANIQTNKQAWLELEPNLRPFYLNAKVSGDGWYPIGVGARII